MTPIGCIHLLRDAHPIHSEWWEQILRKQLPVTDRQLVVCKLSARSSAIQIGESRSLESTANRPDIALVWAGKAKTCDKRRTWSRTPASLKPLLVLRQNIEVHYLKWLKTKRVGFSRLQFDDWLPAVFLPWTPRPVNLRFSRW